MRKGKSKRFYLVVLSGRILHSGKKGSVARAFYRGLKMAGAQLLKSREMTLDALLPMTYAEPIATDGASG